MDVVQNEMELTWLHTYQWPTYLSHFLRWVEQDGGILVMSSQYGTANLSQADPSTSYRLCTSMWTTCFTDGSRDQVHTEFGSCSSGGDQLSNNW